MPLKQLAVRPHVLIYGGVSGPQTRKESWSMPGHLWSLWKPTTADSYIRSWLCWGRIRILLTPANVTEDSETDNTVVTLWNTTHLPKGQIPSANLPENVGLALPGVGTGGSGARHKAHGVTEKKALRSEVPLHQTLLGQALRTGEATRSMGS